MRIYVAMFQRGATGWEFQIGRLYWQINYPRYMFVPRSRMCPSGFNPGHIGWEKREDYEECLKD